MITRADALAQLDDFLPLVGKYASTRNYDYGPKQRDNVSMLSRYIRHRVILEDEVALAVLRKFAFSTVEKFLQEVAWRSYWKGWLEMRPDVWTHYLDGLADSPVTIECAAAMEGRTGIACFDAWCRELVEAGYLHNHARMWFASIWIFTLQLPWQVGADFFLRHLLDGDPASNTLSWRWVAGLHTRGKHYLARAENIAHYTKGRFDPTGQLNEKAEALPLDRDFSRKPLLMTDWKVPTGKVGHLLVAEDLGPPPCRVHASAVWHPMDAADVSPLIHAARSAACDDAAVRSGGQRLSGEFFSAVQAWMQRESLDSLIVAYPTVGLWKPLIGSLAKEVPITIFTRAWDRALWPHATAGFFRMREKLPAFFKALKNGVG